MIEEKGNTSLNKNETVLKIDLPKKKSPDSLNIGL